MIPWFLCLLIFSFSCCSGVCRKSERSCWKKEKRRQQDENKIKTLKNITNRKKLNRTRFTTIYGFHGEKKLFFTENYILQFVCFFCKFRHMSNVLHKLVKSDDGLIKGFKESRFFNWGEKLAIKRAWLRSMYT